MRTAQWANQKSESGASFANQSERRNAEPKQTSIQLVFNEYSTSIHSPENHSIASSKFVTYSYGPAMK